METTIKTKLSIGDKIYYVKEYAKNPYILEFEIQGIKVSYFKDIYFLKLEICKCITYDCGMEIFFSEETINNKSYNYFTEESLAREKLKLILQNKQKEIERAIKNKYKEIEALKKTLDKKK